MTPDSSVYAVLISFIICVLLCPVMIPYLQRLKFGQFVREDGPQSHIKKAGTPTMGGIIIIISFVITAAVFFFTKRMNHDGLAVTFVTLAFGIIGFLDDYIKVVKKRSLGLRAWQKLILQLLVTLVFAYYMLYVKHAGTEVMIPFANGYALTLGVLYIPFLLFVTLGTVNGVNFTDGLDGLVSGVTVIVAVWMCFMALFTGNAGIAAVSGALIGSLMGFLIYNSFPARVFMGDTGSLALGGYVAACAFILKMPLFIAIVGIVYLAEVISVILQVGYFKYTRRKYGQGKRLFKMSPIHHHFEELGWSETKVVALFYIVTALACLIGYLAARGIG